MHLRYLAFCIAAAATSLCSAQTAQPHNLKPQPLLFLENKGQILDFNQQPRPDILFMMRAQSVNVFVGKGTLHYLFTQPRLDTQSQAILTRTSPETMSGDFTKSPDEFASNEPIIYETYRIDVSLKGMNPNAEVEGIGKNTYYENYYNVPGHYTDGILNVHSFEKIVMRNVYPNIDWVLYSKDGKLKHEFVLHQGADYKQIQLSIKGATEMAINDLGELLITTPQGTVAEDKPFIPENTQIQGAFELNKIADLEYEVGYELMGINEIVSEITIDPGIEWNTYFGGTQIDVGVASAILEDKLYFGGFTSSYNFISYNAYQSTNAGAPDMYLTRFSEGGTRLWATYYGGTESDYLYSIKACSKGILAGGATFNSGLGHKGYDTSLAISVNTDGFVFLLDTNGMLEWSTYVGGVGYDFIMDVGTLANGNYAVTGWSVSSGLGTSGVHQPTRNAYFDNIIAVIDSSGKTLHWLSYLGGSEEDNNYASLCVGNFIYLVGSTLSSSGMTKNGFQNSYAGGRDGNIAKFDSAGNLVWASYFGTSSLDVLSDIAEFNGDIYVVGGSYSSSGMQYGNAYQTSSNGGFEAVFARITASGSKVWSTYYGDKWDQVGRGCVVDDSGLLWLLVSHTGGFSTLGHHLYQDVSSNNPNTAFLLTRLDTACRYVDGTFYYGIINYQSQAGIATFCSSLSEDKDNVCTNAGDNDQFNTIRNKHQLTMKGASDAIFTKWNINSFAQPKIVFEDPICPGGKLKVYSEQYAVGRTPNAKTMVQLSDSNGIFNGNSKILHTRSDTLSRYEYIIGTLPSNCPASKKYRVRMLLNNPPDTSEVSLPFEILPKPKGEIVPLSNYEMCSNDSLRLELDSQGKNKVRWYRITGPTSNPADTNKVFYAKLGGKHSALLTSPDGCTYMTNSVTILQWPHSPAGFISSATEACEKGNVFSFTDTSIAASGDVITSLNWYFGDGQTSALFNPNHSYLQPGKYEVKLGIGTQRGCHDTAYLTVNVWPDPLAKLFVNKTLLCLRGNKFYFKDSSVISGDSITERIWWINGNKADLPMEWDSSFLVPASLNIHLEVEGSHGCAHDTSVSIKIAGHPITQIQSDKPGFCPGDSTKLEVTNPNALDYQWYQNGNKLNGETKTTWHAKNAGNYAVRVTTSDGCDTISNAVDVKAYANPKPNLGVDKTLKYDSAVTLDPGIFKTYSWKNGTNTNTLLVNNSNLDTGANLIWVTVSDSNSCKGTDSAVIILEKPLGTYRLAGSAIKVYPVPVDDVLIIEIPEMRGSWQFKIHDATGKIILMGNLESEINEVDLSHTASGVYLLVIETKGDALAFKIMK